MKDRDTTIVITPGADLVITDMQQRVDEVARTYGQHSAEHVTMLESLVNALATIVRSGGTISRDGQLGLYGVSWIHYGIVFHAKYLPDGKTRDPLLGEWSSHS